MTPPAFQFYVDNFIEGTVEMTDAELGLYIRLLCAQWTRGSLPTDNAELARFSRGVAPSSLSDNIARVKLKFKVGDNGMMRNARMETERAKQARYRENRSESGKLGNAKRWHSDGTAIAEPIAKHRSPSPSPSPSPSTNTHRESECVILPLSKQKSDFSSDTRFEWLSGELCRLYKRPAKRICMGEEEHLVAEVSRRPDVRIELDELKRCRREIGEKYFPQSLAVLCRDWDKTLDRARNHAPPPAAHKDKSIAEKEIDKMAKSLGL